MARAAPAGILGEGPMKILPCVPSGGPFQAARPNVRVARRPEKGTRVHSERATQSGWFRSAARVRPLSHAPRRTQYRVAPGRRGRFGDRRLVQHCCAYLAFVQLRRWSAGRRRHVRYAHGDETALAGTGGVVCRPACQSRAALHEPTRDGDRRQLLCPPRHGPRVVAALCVGHSAGGDELHRQSCLHGGAEIRSTGGAALGRERHLDRQRVDCPARRTAPGRPRARTVRRRGGLRSQWLDLPRRGHDGDSAGRRVARDPDNRLCPRRVRRTARRRDRGRSHQLCLAPAAAGSEPVHPGLLECRPSHPGHDHALRRARGDFRTWR
jgi:hypothetical protein